MSALRFLFFKILPAWHKHILVSTGTQLENNFFSIKNKWLKLDRSFIFAYCNSIAPTGLVVFPEILYLLGRGLIFSQWIPTLPRGLFLSGSPSSGSSSLSTCVRALRRFQIQRNSLLKFFSKAKINNYSPHCTLLAALFTYLGLHCFVLKGITCFFFKAPSIFLVGRTGTYSLCWCGGWSRWYSALLTRPRPCFPGKLLGGTKALPGPVAGSTIPGWGSLCPKCYRQCQHSIWLEEHWVKLWWTNGITNGQHQGDMGNMGCVSSAIPNFLLNLLGCFFSTPLPEISITHGPYLSKASTFALTLTSVNHYTLLLALLPYTSSQC